MVLQYRSDVVIVGGGLAGIVTAMELIQANLRVLVVDRDDEERLGGLARESFGGVMLVGTPHQRRMRIRDTPDLALRDWHTYAQFDPEDEWPRRWARAYVNESESVIFSWLHERGVRFLPLVNWPERGMMVPGNSVPRWHIALGTGRGMVSQILAVLERHPKRGLLTMVLRHRVERLEMVRGQIQGVAGVRETDMKPFSVAADAVVLATGGVCGGDLGYLRTHWDEELGPQPETILNGAHRYADGTIHEMVRHAGGAVTHLERQWHYAAGVFHPHPRWPQHGLSLVPPRSALWLNRFGERISAPPLVGYTDTRYLVHRICHEPGQYSWQVMNWKIAIKELAVSGAEYMTAFVEKNRLKMLRDVLFGNRELVQRLIFECPDVVTARSVEGLAANMNARHGDRAVQAENLVQAIRRFDEEIDRGPAFFNDEQLRRIIQFRQYRGDRIRLCRFQKIDDPEARPLIAIRLFVLSRKSLGGIQTDLDCRVLCPEGKVMPGLYAVGEAAGFGGGGIHGRRALEGTFLGSCVLTGWHAAHAIKRGHT